MPIATAKRRVKHAAGMPGFDPVAVLARPLPVVQNLPDWREHVDEHFKSIGDLMQAANVKIE